MKRKIHVHLDAEMPERKPFSSGEAISMSSPNGRVSQRSQAVALKKLSMTLFGPGGLQQGSVAQPGRKDTLLRQAGELRALAARGMGVHKHIKEAERLEAEAAKL